MPKTPMTIASIEPAAGTTIALATPVEEADADAAEPELEEPSVSVFIAEEVLADPVSVDSEEVAAAEEVFFPVSVALL